MWMRFVPQARSPGSKENAMAVFQWILKNFGIVFGPLFLWYLFCTIRRAVVLWDLLKFIPGETDMTTSARARSDSVAFLAPLFARLTRAAASGAVSAQEALRAAIMCEFDARIGVHFAALKNYMNTLIMLGFAGTIFGAIGAFGDMLGGLEQGRHTSEVFLSSWEHGLSTSLYTSLAAALIVGPALPFLSSRILFVRAQRLESIINISIADIVEEYAPCTDHGAQAASLETGMSSTSEKTSSASSSSFLQSSC
jgi:hypothetical protein